MWHLIESEKQCFSKMCHKLILLCVTIQFQTLLFIKYLCKRVFLSLIYHSKIKLIWKIFGCFANLFSRKLCRHLKKVENQRCKYLDSHTGVTRHSLFFWHIRTKKMSSPFSLSLLPPKSGWVNILFSAQLGQFVHFWQRFDRRLWSNIYNENKIRGRP